MRARVSLAVLLVAVAVPIAASSTRPSASETASWRAQREKDLASDTGWLTVAGLSFLKPGANTVGSDRNNDVVLPSPAPRQAGTLERDGRDVWFTPAAGGAIALNGAAVTSR